MCAAAARKRGRKNSQFTTLKCVFFRVVSENFYLRSGVWGGYRGEIKGYWGKNTLFFWKHGKYFVCLSANLTQNKMETKEVKSKDISEVDEVILPSSSFMGEHFKAFANEFRQLYQVPMDMITTAFLANASFLLQFRGNEVKFGAYVDKPTLFFMLIAEPSGGKTPVITKLTAPVYEFENATLDSIKATYDEKRALTTSAERLAQLTSEYKVKMFRNRLSLAGDMTPEALVWAVSQARFTSYLIEDEAQILFDSMRRHRAGGMFSLFSTLFDGKPFVALRRSQEDSIARNPRLTCLVGLQPIFARRVFGGVGMLSGFTGRWLVCYKQRVPSDYVLTRSTGDAADFRNRHCTFFKELMRYPSFPRGVYEFSQELYDSAYTYVSTRRAFETSAPDTLRYNLAMKLGYFFPRIAACVHILREDESRVITRDDVDATASILDAYLRYASMYDANVGGVSPRRSEKFDDYRERFLKHGLTKTTNYATAASCMPELKRTMFYKIRRSL